MSIPHCKFIVLHQNALVDNAKLDPSSAKIVRQGVHGLPRRISSVRVKRELT